MKAPPANDPPAAILQASSLLLRLTLARDLLVENRPGPFQADRASSSIVAPGDGIVLLGVVQRAPQRL